MNLPGKTNNLSYTEALLEVLAGLNNTNLLSISSLRNNSYQPHLTENNPSFVIDGDNTGQITYFAYFQTGAFINSYYGNANNGCIIKRIYTITTKSTGIVTTYVGIARTALDYSLDWDFRSIYTYDNAE